MTKPEAIKRAKEQWGENAFVKSDANLYFVGELNGPIRTFYGHGPSWEEAFKKAELAIN